MKTQNRHRGFTGIVVLICWLLAGTLCGTAARAQQAGMSGQVTDAKTHTPIVGATVRVEGTQIATSTDALGKYRLPALPEKGTLIFSYVGYESKNVAYHAQQTVIDVTMSEDVQNLDDVVVVGYISNSKRETTTAISSLRDKDLTSVNSANLLQSIQGLVPGVQIGSSNGTPGAETDFYIRGVGTVNAGMAPLCIIDDVVEEDGLTGLNINDVESVQILKDAASTAIYGAAGANGVIIITTKRGKDQRAEVSLEAKFGLSEVARYYEMMNSEQCMDMMEEAGVKYWSLPGFDPNLNTDWQKAITRRAFTQSYSLSVRGGNDRVQYAVSGSFYDQPGILINTDYKRYNMRANIDAKLSRRIKMWANFTANYTDQSAVKDQGQQGGEGVMVRTLQMPPMFPVYYNGTYWTQNNYTTEDLVADPRDPSRLPGNSMPLQHIENPVKILTEQSIRTLNQRYTGSIGLNIELAKGLVFKPRFNFLMSSNSYRNWRPASIGERYGKVTDGNASMNFKTISSWETEHVLLYNRIFNGQHKINAALGANINERLENYTYVKGIGFGSDALGTLNGATSFTANDLPSLRDRNASFFFRANYSFRERYLVGVVLRADGSSKFGANNRFGYFPSVSAGWIASDESFFRWAKPVLSMLKLRSSYGVAGNNAIGRYKYESFLSARNYVFGDEVSNGLAVANIANPDLGWERKRSTNLGLELGLFDNRIYLTVDAYRDVTDDMLLNANIPATLGQSTMTLNIGSVENKGLEFGLSTHNISRRYFQWSTRFNISFNRNKVLSLSGDADMIYDGESGTSNVTMEGWPIGVFYGRVYKGVYMNWEEIRALAADPNSGLAFDPKTVPGDMKFVDLNGDGVIDDNDRTIIGTPHPEFTAGLSNTLQYRNIALSFLLTGQYGNQIYNYTIHDMARSVNNNAIAAYDRRWRSEESPGDGWYPVVEPKSGASADRNKFSNYQLEDASYLCIKNVSLGYTFPASLLKKSFIKALSVSLNVDNLHTFTRYTGQNIEANNYRRATALGIDYTSYPLARTYTMSIQVKF